MHPTRRALPVIGAEARGQCLRGIVDEVLNAFARQQPGGAGGIASHFDQEVGHRASVLAPDLAGAP
jgi:hypothetical protein